MSVRPEEDYPFSVRGCHMPGRVYRLADEPFCMITMMRPLSTRRRPRYEGMSIPARIAWRRYHWPHLDRAQLGPFQPTSKPR